MPEIITALILASIVWLVAVNQRPTETSIPAHPYYKTLNNPNTR